MSAVKPTIKRRESTKIYVGNVPIGGDAPIAVQSMTNTRTTDVEATVALRLNRWNASAQISCVFLYLPWMPPKRLKSLNSK